MVMLSTRQKPAESLKDERCDLNRQDHPLTDAKHSCLLCTNLNPESKAL